jgi:hypothetical protein
MTAVPSIHRWLAGDEVNAVRANEIKDLIDFLRNPPTVHVRRRLSNFAFTAASGSYFTVTFDTLVNSYDPYGMWDVGATDRLTIKVPGWYSCEMVTAWVGTAQNLRYTQVLAKNGMTFDDMILRHDQTTLPNSTTVVRKESMLYLNEGDNIRLGVSTEGTGTFTLTTANDSESPQLRIRWVSN